MAAGHVAGPHIDWGGLAPLIVLSGGALLVLLVGLLPGPVARHHVVPGLTLLTLAASIGFEIAQLNHTKSIVSGALAIDGLAMVLDMIFAVAAMAAVLLSWRASAPREAGGGEYHSLLLFSVMGMAVLVSAQNLVTLFIGLELLSIPLYILCASESRREPSLESGLKYLVIGSVGSATLVYGLALVYGASGSTDFASIAGLVSTGKLTGGLLGDSLLFIGLAMVIVGFAFKASVAPFHQWTPDVYEGAPTAITAFMATATKAAALGAFLRFFDVAVIGAQNDWAPLVAAIAAVTIIVGNVGALGQSSLKRMLGYSGVAQAGYMLGGVVVGTQLGADATVLYLMVYLAMNLAAFAVIAAVERPGDDIAGDEIGRLAGLGARAPWLAWPMTIAMLALAGIPGTVGFIGKFQLIHALVNGNYTWLAIVLVIGSTISLGYYLRVVAMMWMRSVGAASEAPGAAPTPALAPIAGGSGEEETSGDGAPSVRATGNGDGSGSSDAVGSEESSRRPELAFAAILFGAASVFFGIFPSPLFNLAAHAGHALSGLF
ncbi:MAG: NADH-quinone oxidoreductase subunit N [Solirubrobacterales bacterium]|nr:NADH-quinone oxidoreductase subunit N [Solirubrobacterales bacterium]